MSCVEGARILFPPYMISSVLLETLSPLRSWDRVLNSIAGWMSIRAPILTDHFLVLKFHCNAYETPFFMQKWQKLGKECAEDFYCLNLKFDFSFCLIWWSLILADPASSSLWVRIIVIVGFTMLIIGVIANSKSRVPCSLAHRHFLSTGGILCFVHGVFGVAYYVSADASKRE